MVTMTSKAEVIVRRPPSPLLGNFNKIFSNYLSAYSDTEPKISGDKLLPLTLPDLDVLWGLKQVEQEKNKTTSNEKFRPGPAGLQSLGEATPTAQSKKFASSSPQFGHHGSDLPPVTPDDLISSSTRMLSGSHSTTQSQSIFDNSYQRSLMPCTPMSTPDTVRDHGASHKEASPSIDCGDVFVGTPRTHTYMASGLSAVVNNKAAYSSNGLAAAGYGVRNAAPSSPAITGSYLVGPQSSNGTFRYSVSAVQPYTNVGAHLFSVDFAGTATKDCIKPHYMSTKEDKLKILYAKLGPTLLMDRTLEAKMPTHSRKVHVFVDLSNITIGFYDALKLSHNIPVNKRMKAPRFCFGHLAHILERGRDVEKRVLAGSLLTTYARKWPDYMQEAKSLGYDMNILQRVIKASSPTRKGRGVPRSDPEWTASDDCDSPNEDMAAVQMKQGEQGVDELLHLKMCQSALDARPGTAVIATGDAAEAEFSDGFKANVERLLRQGWNVEIIGWSKGLSKAWRDSAFTEQWSDQVRLIELDPFVEELFGAWFGAPGFTHPISVTLL
ncbi:hypothetical protein DL546_001662 [Coniochaeta pulveracea]|uniref:NYN domain-containing protein n=1 Tax=Coniochaeta pulveracea TaxID=177199 RepID=A0A420Y0B4_9PEZI|nr:hypothetical protein DL546_001662 [Coniochaeta pulveracea]